MQDHSIVWQIPFVGEDAHWVWLMAAERPPSLVVKLAQRTDKGCPQNAITRAGR